MPHPALTSEQIVTGVRAQLREHGAARAEARATMAEHMEHIAVALRVGQQEGMEIKEMAELAGITRQTAYNLITRQG